MTSYQNSSQEKAQEAHIPMPEYLLLSKTTSCQDRTDIKPNENLEMNQQITCIPLQSFMITSPKMWSAASLTSTGFPNSLPGPTIAAWVQ